MGQDFRQLTQVKTLLFGNISFKSKSQTEDKVLMNYYLTDNYNRLFVAKHEISSKLPNQDCMQSLQSCGT